MFLLLLNISHARSALVLLRFIPYIKLNSKALNEAVVCVFACGRPHLSGGLITNWWRVELAWYRLHLIPIRPRGPALYQDVELLVGADILGTEREWVTHNKLASPSSFLTWPRFEGLWYSVFCFRYQYIYVLSITIFSFKAPSLQSRQCSDARGLKASSS